MSDAYKKMWAKINRDAKKAQDMKYKMRTEKDVRDLIFIFLNAVEDAMMKYADKKMELAYEIEKNIRFLQKRFHVTDPGSRITIIWHNEKEADNVTDLRVEAVSIRWSDEYIQKYPEVPQEEYVSVEQLMMERIFN